MKKYYIRISCSHLFLACAFLFSFHTSAQTTYYVNTTSDTEDVDLQDSLCADADGNCSLRAAIQNANLSPETDNIHFNIPGEGPHEVVLEDDLPVLTERVILDARTQNGYTTSQSQVVLMGSRLTDKWDENDKKVPRVVLFLAGNSSGSEISGLTIGGIASSFSIGIYARGTGNHWIFENKIGCTADGSALLGNNGYGMYFQKSHFNQIGADTPESRNVISGNHVALALDFANSNTIINNFIGTDWSGQNFLGNGDGILTWKNTQEEISSGNLSSHNIIKGNVLVGAYRALMIRGDYNLVEENFIGTDITGTKSYNTTAGILLSGGSYNRIGGEKGNLISGNDHGLTVYAPNNEITNNLIGTDISGEAALPNNVGIIFQTRSSDYDSRNNIVENNVISGNLEGAVLVKNSFENHIRSNIIGLNKTADAPLPNRNGIILSTGNQNQVTENRVAANTYKGIIINATQERLSRNLIYGNGEIGIDLRDNGITQNDIADKDSGPNNLQNFPDLSSASYGGVDLEVQFYMDSDPAYSSYPLTIEFFISDGSRQGKEYLGAYQLTENNLPKGKKPISISLALPDGSLLQDGELLIATATDAAGNSSEFSNEIAISVSGGCTTYTFYADTDTDGYGDPENVIEACEAPSGYVSNAEDCDDTDASVYPGALDNTTDGIDQNCDGVDGPVTACSSPELLMVTEVCSTATEVYWRLENQGDCTLSGSWKLRKVSSTGPSNGVFELSPGQYTEFSSGISDKGKTQIIVNWTDGSGAEYSSSVNASGIECSGTLSSTESSSADEMYISPNPIGPEGINLYFTPPASDSELSTSVYNSSGQLMASEVFFIPSGTDHVLWEIDHSSWEEGSYILQATLNGQEHSIQFIK